MSFVVFARHATGEAYFGFAQSFFSCVIFHPNTMSIMSAVKKNACPTERHQSVYLHTVCESLDLEQHGDDFLVCG